MKRRIMTAAIALCYLPLLMASGATFTFNEENFDDAKRRASAEGKMLLVDFYASWCGPCKWMEETTFADPGVKERMSTGYVTVKVNIDDFDGYALKEHYDVTVLPTVLIFNNDGKIVERIEETLPPSKMRTVLDKNKGESSTIVHTPNTAPAAKYVADKNIDNANEIREANYSLQLGVFSNYSSTLEFYKGIKRKTDQPMIILHDYKGTSVIYRVLMGSFSNTTEAEIQKTRLQDDLGIETTLFY